jgi:4-hydroxybenzoate polyprenyltransferase
LVVCGFLGALLLALCKRRADLDFLGDKAAQHRPVFQYYSLSLLDQVISITAGMTIVSYALYTIETEPGGGLLIWTVPLVTFLIFRYIYLLQAQSQIARNPERLFLDIQLLLGGIILIIFFVIRLYLGDIFDSFDIFNPEESFEFLSRFIN